MIQETVAFIGAKYPQWSVSGDKIEFRVHKVTKADDIPAERLISQTLTYATELERII